MADKGSNQSAGRHPESAPAGSPNTLGELLGVPGGEPVDLAACDAGAAPGALADTAPVGDRLTLMS